MYRLDTDFILEILIVVSIDLVTCAISYKSRGFGGCSGWDAVRAVWLQVTNLAIAPSFNRDLAPTHKRGR
jgi:hypothetical protein